EFKENFLRFSALNHEWTRIDTNEREKAEPRMTRITRIARSALECGGLAPLSNNHPQSATSLKENRAHRDHRSSGQNLQNRSAHAFAGSTSYKRLLCRIQPAANTASSNRFDGTISKCERDQ